MAPRNPGWRSWRSIDSRGLRPPCTGAPGSESSAAWCLALRRARCMRHLGLPVAGGIAPQGCSPSGQQAGQSRIPAMAGPACRSRSRGPIPGAPGWPPWRSKTSVGIPASSALGRLRGVANALQLRELAALSFAGSRPACVAVAPCSRNCAGRSCLPLGGRCRRQAGNLRQRSFSEPIRRACPSCVTGDRTYISRAAEKLRRQHQRSEHDHGVRAQQPVHGTSFTGKAGHRHPAAWAGNDTAVLLAGPALPLAERFAAAPQTTAEGGCAAAETAARWSGLQPHLFAPLRPTSSRRRREPAWPRFDWAQSPLWPSRTAPSSGPPVACGPAWAMKRSASPAPPPPGLDDIPVVQALNGRQKARPVVVSGALRGGTADPSATDSASGLFCQYSARPPRQRQQQRDGRRQARHPTRPPPPGPAAPGQRAGACSLL